MSDIRLNLLAADRTIHGCVHWSEGDRIVAALASDPQTIEELALAVGRYRHIDEDGTAFAHFRNGLNEKPYDAGLFVIDLVGRRIAWTSTASCCAREGTVSWHNGHCDTEIGLPYSLADDWVIHDHDDASWGRLWEDREPPADPADERAVLYGRLPAFLARELHERQDGLAELDDAGSEQLVRDLHTRWLMTPRDDLAGRTPREVMIDARHRHVIRDLEFQQHRWSFVRSAPPGIPRKSHAYRFGGFGRHEVVLYYELVRELLWEGLHRFLVRPIAAADLAAETDHLQRYRQDWLNGPNEDHIGRTPASIIDRERRRLPEACAPGEPIVDPDCPLCEMMADETFGPTFWHLDGSQMDDDFAFSFYETCEEWEEEQRRQEEFNRQFDEKLRRKRAFVEGEIPAEEYLETNDEDRRLWTQSFSDHQALDELPFARAFPILLFGIAAHLAEVCEEFKSLSDGAQRGRSLRSHFTELRYALVYGLLPSAESALDSLTEALHEVASLHAPLALRCADLEARLDHLLTRWRAEPPWDDGIPF